MQFLNPLALIGLAATLIPLAVHLLYRGRPREVPFSNLAFLRELHQSRMRSMRLRQWLVLLLRMLAVACLVLAFARPALQEGGGVLGGSRPTTAVLLVDRSYSTRYTPPAGRVFDRLRRRADEVLSLFDDDRDRVFLVPFAARSDTVPGPLPIASWRERLDNLVPGEGGTDVGRPLVEARVLGNTGMHRETYLFTDLAHGGWDRVEWDEGEDGPLYVIATDDASARNLYVAEHHVAGWLAAPGHKLSVSAVVGQVGGEPTGVSVDLFLDGERVQRRRATLPASATTRVEFTVAPRRGGRLTGSIEIEADALPVDNRRYFTLHVPDRVGVLLAGPLLSDIYYARRALNAAAEGDAALEVESVLLAELDDDRLAAADVLVLCNIDSPSPGTVQRVRRFAESGGGVLLLPGPAADLAGWNRELLSGLVPASLARVTGQPGGPAYVSLDSTRVDPDLFAGLLAKSDDRPRFHAAFEILPERQLAVLARFDDGRPALVEGRGATARALLWAAPLDQAWTDLPLRGSFVPLLHRLCRYLAQPHAHASSYTVGERAWRRLPGHSVDDKVQVESPSGRRRFIEAETALGDLRWEVPALGESGIWRVLGPELDVVDEFAVNVDVAEADITPIPHARLSARPGAAGLRFLDGSAPVQDLVWSARHGRELWRAFLVLAGLLLLLEMWVARAPAAGAPARAA